MPKGTRYIPEHIIGKLREADLELSKGYSAAATAKKIWVAEQTFYRWRKKYGGLRTDQAKRLKALEKENACLKRILADAELDKAILKEPASGKLWAWRSSARQWTMPEMLSSVILHAERPACRMLGQPRSTQRQKKHIPSHEPRLVKRMIELASESGRYGYRQITALLRAEG